ncbi:MAG TPA: MATE family efflux transporter [Longimicrobiales bacterium]
MSRFVDKAQLRALSRLAFPIVIIQVGLMFMGVVDTIMVGHVSAAGLGAVALGNLYFFAAAIFGMGVLLALDPVISQAVGAHDDDAIARAVQRGFVLSLGLTVVASLMLPTAGPVLRWLRQPDDVVPLARTYVLATIPGVAPFFFFVVVRQALQAMHRTRPIVITIVLANLVNVFVNWILIFGNLGAPALGVFGAAIATSISRWSMFFMIVLFSWPLIRPYVDPWRSEAFALRPLGRMVQIGAPIGVAYFLEYANFGGIALLMGLLGTYEVAGHQIAINLASLTFMVPAGVGAAATVLVGNAIGRNDPAAARSSAKAALVAGGGFMLMSAAVFLLFPEVLAGLYTDDPKVLAIAFALIPIAGLFQVFDGLQVVGAGVLRGVGDTRAPMIIGLLGFWLLGMPVSVYLGLNTPLRAAGLWWGFVIGLAAVAGFLLLRIRHRFSRELHRLEVEERHLPAFDIAD